MEVFTESLKKGRLTTTRCLTCGKLIWPPSNICAKCVSNSTEWVDVSPFGKLIEFSESLMTTDPSIFGIVELDDNIRLLGKIHCESSSMLKKGMSVKLIKCGMKNNDAYYEFQLI